MIVRGCVEGYGGMSIVVWYYVSTTVQYIRTTCGALFWPTSEQLSVNGRNGPRKGGI